MTAAGVPGFFGRKKRTRKPVGLEISFIYDSSTSMDDYIDFLEAGVTMQNLQLALIAQNVGVSQENRYAKATMAREYTFNNGIWVDGTTIGSNTAFWENGVRNGPIIGSGDEDQTRSAHNTAVQTTRRGYRSGIERIMISASDEQSDNTLENQVLGALTANDTRQRFVAISGMALTIAVNPGASVGYSPFGFVYTDKTNGVAIYKEDNGANVQYFNVPVSDATWASGSFTWSLTGPVTDTGGGSGTGSRFIQRTNTPRLAYETGGAVYGITDMISGSNTPVGLQAFSTSLGQVLGTFLYETLS